MRLSFLELPGHERRLYFEQAAARRGLSAVVLEKDFAYSGMATSWRESLAGKVDFCSRLDPWVEPIVRREAVTIYEDS
jgi:hypothetical protein